MIVLYFTSCLKEKKHLTKDLEVTYLIIKNIWQPKDLLNFKRSSLSVPIVCIILVWWHTDIQVSILSLVCQG